MATTSPPGVLLLADIARILTEERRKRDGAGAPALKVSTVLANLRDSRAADGRYATNPMPMPAGYLGTSRQAPWWPADTEQAHRDWYNSRPGHGHGTGGRRAGSKVRVAQPPKRRKGTGSKAAGEAAAG
jgi:hypothetical protein